MSTKPIVFAIEDDEVMRHVYHGIFKDDYDIRCYEGADQLFRESEGVVPDLMLIDVGLKGMDGYEVCQRFKEKQYMTNVPVIFVSGSDFSEDKGRAFFSGGAEYVTKPFEEKDIKYMAKRLITMKNEIKH